MAKEKPMTVSDMRDNISALTSIVQLMVKQQAQIVQYLQANDGHLKSIDENVKKLLEPVAFTLEDQKLLDKVSEV